jgi:hypothetical protein
MKDLVNGLLLAGILIFLAYAWGYFRALGYTVASKHKKVCDMCFCDIQRVNEMLRHNKGELNDMEKPSASPDNEKLLKAAEPLIKYLAENYHPHVVCIVDALSAEVYEGQAVVKTKKFLRD